MLCDVREVSGVEYAEDIHRLNALSPDIFPKLKPHHLANGYWWLIFHKEQPRAFAGMVPMVPFDCWYMKRCWIHPIYRGRGWQKILLGERELKARQIGVNLLVSECHETNHASANNFLLCGYTETFPEQPWARNSRFWMKKI